MSNRIAGHLESASNRGDRPPAYYGIGVSVSEQQIMLLAWDGDRAEAEQRSLDRSQEYGLERWQVFDFWCPNTGVVALEWLVSVGVPWQTAKQCILSMMDQIQQIMCEGLDELDKGTQNYECN